MPVCISLEGIHTDKKNAGASGVGFTTEEYESIVMDKSTKMCNSLAMDIMNGEGPDILLNSGFC